jgi:hypothetical protein
MDLATGKVTSLVTTFNRKTGPADAENLVAVDARDLFLLVGGPRGGGAPELAAIDLSTGQERIVAHEPYLTTTLPSGKAASDAASLAVAQIMANETFSESDYALDPTYVYFAFSKPSFQLDYEAQHPEAMKGTHDLGFLARVRRDGAAAVEVLGPGPSAFFIASEGFAYWASPLEGIKRRELVAGATNQIVWAGASQQEGCRATESAETDEQDDSEPSDPYGPMFVGSGRLFFTTVRAGPPRSITIQSVPAGTVDAFAADAGGVDVRTHVPSCDFKSGWGYHEVFDGKCVYSGSYAGLSRVDIDDAREQELISGPTNVVPGSARDFVATDGRYLYWADYTRDRIVRWAR